MKIIRHKKITFKINIFDCGLQKQSNYHIYHIKATHIYRVFAIFMLKAWYDKFFF
jgi:hypothetical protein